MMKLTQTFLGLAITGMLAAAPAFAASEQQQLLDQSATTIAAMKSDPSFGNAKDLLLRARAVMVVPQLVKAGFFLGGEGGSGVLTARTGSGWSNPAFYTVAGASFGLQIGVETAEVVFFVMSDRALTAWMKDEVTLGANAGLTLLVVGSNAEASTTSNADVDVIAWARSKGAYAGITLEGSIIKPRDSYNEAYYGKKMTGQQLLANANAPHGGQTDSLRTALSK
jgi:lipid-binding SYLF domain-containing protein